MFKPASFILAATLVVAALAHLAPAEAATVIGVAVPLPGVTIVTPPAVAVDSYYLPAPYYYPGIVRYGYGYRYGYGHGYRWGHVYGHFRGGYHGRR
jgi:hypothetical protein